MPGGQYGLGSLGGIRLADILKTLRTELENYFGSINEIKMGVRSRTEPKPGALTTVEYIEKMGLPLVAGGLMDQPHIWLLQMEMVIEVRSLFEAISGE